MLIVLWSNFSHLVKPGPWYLREVMMFIMQSHHHVEDVTRAVIRICLKALDEFEVLCNEMSSTRMEAHSQQCTKEQIPECPKPVGVDNISVKSHLHNEVNHLRKRWRTGFHYERTDPIEEWHEKNKDALGEEVSKYLDLDLGWDISISSQNSLVKMVLIMVVPECNGRGYSSAQVCDNTDCKVGIQII